MAAINYDEFGVILNPGAVNTNGNIFAYTGHVYDGSTGFYYAKARYYDTATSCMLSEDTNRGDPKNPLSLNLYTTVGIIPLGTWIQLVIGLRQKM